MAIKNNFKHTFFASYAGYFVQAIINNFLPLLFLTFQSDFSLSYEKLSLLIVINFAVQLCIDFLSVNFIDKIGYRKSAVIAHILAFLGLFSLSFLPFIITPYTGIIVSIVTYALGSGLIEVIISPLVEACPSERKSASMSLLHSFYCWGQMSVVLFSTVFFVLFGTENWRFLAAIWSVVPLVNCIYFCLVPIPKVLSENKGMSVKELFRSKLLYIFATIMLCAGACEIAMAQWASAFAESALNVSKTIGDLLGPCMFAVLMGSSRVLYAKLSHKISLRRVITISALICFASYLVSGISKNAIISLIGCAVCGLGVGIMWPGTFSLAAKKIPKGGTALFALLALFGDSGCMTGPAIVGKLASVFGDDLKKALVFACVFPLILIICINAERKINK